VKGVIMQHACECFTEIRPIPLPARGFLLLFIFAMNPCLIRV
jgi:hypothetical protein